MSMDNISTIISHILHACRLAREMEANLHNLANSHPSLLRSSCEDITRAFNNAIHQIDAQQQGLQAMDLFGQSSMEEQGIDILSQMETLGFGIGSSSAAASFSANSQEMESQYEMPQQAMAAVAAAAAGSSMQPGQMGRRPSGGSTGQRHSRKRKENKGMRTVRVPAVRTGNMENPPDDGYTWRKYGQKDILGSRFPRSYFRCTHKSFYGCDAKKQVQRLDEDPYTYEVTYCGEHSCQTSTTPLILPPLVTNSESHPQIAESGMANTVQLQSASLSTSIQLGASWFDVGQRDLHHHGGESSGAGHAGTGTPECPVTDLADVMFNSGSSGSSMDAIFSLKNESWKGDK